MAAFLMATYMRGMSDEETADLTLAMARSGRTYDLSGVPGPKVDKHSTGGVGDKVSLILAPLCASLGMVVPMISGRGLGHTGGTLDKLEAIPGFTVSLSEDRFLDILSTTKVAIAGATSDLAPADRLMYALRDVTGTVGSVPLICGSIMCKKIAENPDALLLDVKTGNGAFMQETEDALELARLMIAAGEGANKPTVAMLTSMEQPLGRAVGNWLEVRESVEVLAGGGPADLRELVLAQCAHMLLLGELPEAISYASARAMAEEKLQNGEALAAFRAMVRAQGGDDSVIDPENLDSYPQAAGRAEVRAQSDGFVTGFATTDLGMTSVALGAGRAVAGEAVDACAGMLIHKKIGDEVKKGDLLLELFSERGDNVLEVCTRRAAACVTVDKEREEPAPLISHFVDHDGAALWDSGELTI